MSLSKRFVVWSFLVCGLAASACQSSEKANETAEKKGKIELARQFVEGSDNDKAVAILQDLVRAYPNDAEIHYLYGLALLGMRNIQAAHDRFEKVVSLNGDMDDARLSLAYAKIALRRNEGARAELRKILDRGEYMFMERVYVNLGLVDMQQGRCEQALANFQSAVDLDPTLATAYFNQGKCLLKLRRSKPALEALDKAVRFCPGCAEPRLEWARALVSLGRGKEAAAALQELLTREDAEGTHARARALLRSMGQTKNRTR